MKLLLFDIDGTLLHAVGAGRRAVMQTFQELFGTSGRAAQIQMAGMTDPLIARASLEAEGLTPAEIEARLPEVWALYPQHLARELAAHPAAPCIGIPPLLDALSARDDVVLGLLTGNMEAAAWLKMESAGLAHYFSFGAFGNEGPERDKLPAIAIEKAFGSRGHRFAGPDVVIIGDTPHDISCGRHLGVRTVAVCTGPYGAEALAEATVVLPSFEQTDVALKAILGS